MQLGPLRDVFSATLEAGHSVTLQITLTPGGSATPALPANPPDSQVLELTPGSLKLKECALRYGVPVRELERAIDGGSMVIQEKEDGRDAGARLVAPEVVERSRETRQAILAGELVRAVEVTDALGGGR